MAVASAGSVQSTITTVEDNTTTLINTLYPAIDFWSAPQEEVAVTNAATDTSLPSVGVSGIPSGASVVRAIVIFKFRAVENTNAAVNKLSGAQNIQIKLSTDSTWTTAIAIPDDSFGIAASTREGGDVLIGATDMSAVVTADGTYSIQWALAVADQSNLNFNDCQVGLRLWYHG